MGRLKKIGVDYFPHDTKSGKTMFTLESQYGNDGYAFWFKLLELLGVQENHAYDCNKPADWLFLIAKTKVTEEQAEGILNTLAQLDAIDAELWDQKIIWSQNFVDRLTEVYRKRGTDAPTKPNNCDGNTDFRDRNTTSEDISAPESTQRELKKRELNKTKEKETKETTKGDKPPAAEAASKEPVPFKKIQELFKETCPSYPAIRAINGQRKKAVAARWNEHKDIEVFKALFEKAEASSFLKGRNERNWAATFDWMMKPTNFLKILEDNYQEKSSKDKEPADSTSDKKAPVLTGFKMATSSDEVETGPYNGHNEEKPETTQDHKLTGFKMATDPDDED